MPDVWFSADLHLGHGRIIQYCNRPFADHQTMDECIIQRFNEVVKKGDVLYILGDVSWASFDIHNYFLKRLNTREVHLILGNHDNLDPKRYLDMGFRSVSEYKEIRMDVVKGTPEVAGSSRSVVLCHYPFRSWNGKGKGGFALYGHCHGNLEPGLDRSMDVGVDTNDYYPYAWEDIRERLLAKPIFSETTSREFTTGMGAQHPNRIEA